MATILKRRRWRWIGHLTRQEASIAKTALHWTPEGRRKRGRPKITWRRSVEKEIKEMWKTWGGGGHQAYGKGPAAVEGACCCPTCHLCVKGMTDLLTILTVTSPIVINVPIRDLLAVETKVLVL